MNDVNFVSTIRESFYDLADQAIDFLPKLLVALLLLLVGLVVAKAVSTVIDKLVNYVETHKLTKMAMKKLGVSIISLSGIAAFFVRWSILLIFVGAAVDVLNLTALTDTFDSLIGFLPNIFAFAVVAGLSIIAGNVVKDIVTESAQKAKVANYSTLASAAKAVILVFGLTLAIAQLGLDLTIINNNLTVIMAGIMLALGLAFGLGGRDVAGKIVDDMYKNSKK
ncbi:hypothetical protein KC878_04440 [Candidatus Saccharibacteria bacterium]|nr:hypothetical protein [Candidatus Saccharibacteria bacterium]MCB9821449.1 hypothetical protein [Candidatus Nomurabacteria bacterium]